jgi:pimeloyl-ACP methyl ester carboxylesterase
MKWLIRIGVTVFVLAAFALAVLAVGSLASLDRDRTHAARVAALPAASPVHPDGEVRVEVGKFSFRARVAGLDGPGPGLILLHGFPETSTMWLPVMEAAVSAGYRVVAFDQRGYSPGARPEQISAYAIPQLVEDVARVADVFGFEQFHLVGHDWGSVVGWSFIMRHPSRVHSWTSLSIPHVGVFIRSMQDGMPTYINLLRVPWLPEALLTFNRLALMRPSYESMPDVQARDYYAVFSEPGALRAAINWYRALPEGIRTAAGVPLEIDRPVLFIWGKHDFWGSRPERKQQIELMRGPYHELELDAGHSLIEEEPEIVTDAILEHLLRVDGGSH